MKHQGQPGWLATVLPLQNGANVTFPDMSMSSDKSLYVQTNPARPVGVISQCLRLMVLPSVGLCSRTVLVGPTFSSLHLALLFKFPTAPPQDTAQDCSGIQLSPSLDFLGPRSCSCPDWPETPWGTGP